MTIKQGFSPRNDDIDLHAICGTLLDNKRLLMVVTGLFLLISVIYAVLATPIYQASTLLQVEQKVPSLPGLDDLNQTLGISTSQAVTEIALLTSRMVVGQAVSDLKLDTESAPEHFPVFGAFMARRFKPAVPGDVAPALGGLTRYDWGGAKLDIAHLDLPSDLLEQQLYLVAGSGGTYTLQDDDGTTLLTGRAGETASGQGITLQVDALHANPGTRFDVIEHAHLATVALLQKQLDAEEQGKDSGIIQLTYRNANPVLATQLLARISTLYVRQNVDRSSAEAANSLKFVRQQLPNVQLQLGQATQAMNAFQRSAHSVDISMQTKALLDQVVAIETSLQQLHMQMSDMQQHFTPEHPAYKALAQQIGQLEAKRGALQKQIGQLPNTQQQLLRLSRDVQVSNQTYTSLLNQAQQLAIAQAGTVGNVRVIDQAATDTTKPVWPLRAVVVLGGTLLGGMLAIGFVFLRRMLNPGVEDPAAIERLGLPVYASIPRSDLEQANAPRGRRQRARGRQSLLALSAPADTATEALRGLRTSLHFAQLEAKNNVLMISSSSPGAGKTFVASNLAVVIAQAGQRVLLIDADMRKGALHTAIGGRGDTGLSEVLSGQVDLAQAVRKVEGVANLYFISRGKIPPNPSELLMHSNFTLLLDTLKPRFDLIVVDTPPVLAVTDATVVGHHAGTSLMVVRFGFNQAREIAVAVQRCEQNGVAIKGAIFNLVEKRSAGYAAYAYYAYAGAEA
jgi:tyrosine-protein kinase Etk/Wzc